jgi:hypothetical protein
MSPAMQWVAALPEAMNMTLMPCNRRQQQQQQRQQQQQHY